jgi:hypothetical protein
MNPGRNKRGKGRRPIRVLSVTELLPLVYEELRKLAAQKMAQGSAAWGSPCSSADRMRVTSIIGSTGRLKTQGQDHKATVYGPASSPAARKRALPGC